MAGPSCEVFKEWPADTNSETGKTVLSDARSEQSTTIVALHSTPREDLYVVFAGMTEDSKAEIAAHVNPLVFWIWFGAAIMMAGAGVTLLPEKSSR